MYVNISRSKQLFSSRRVKRKAREASVSPTRCNHCGGAIRVSCELTSCLMCSREVGHICDRCSFAPVQLEDKKKSA